MTSALAQPNGSQFPNFASKASDDAKLCAVLSNLNSTEVRLCYLASKDFISLINGENGGTVIFSYARLSVDFSELKSAWKLRHEKGNGLWYVFKVVHAVLNHPDGKFLKSGDRERLVVSRSIDKLAAFVIEEKMQDVYGEIKSKDGKRQSAALMLLGAVVRRGSGLAYDVAKVFDFKMPGFGKLAVVRRLKDSDKKVKSKTRKSYVWFAMSFLDVGKPALLRFVLRQRDLYYSILRSLSDDDDDTIEYVLITLRDRVLTPESLLPPSLRSVLFGSNTLEQLINISGRDCGGSTAELCHELLVMVCTDPCNGLMPDSEAHPNPLKGNRKRLVDLMKKLRATENDYHKALLLSIVKGRPSLGSAYFDEFPYNVEDHASTNWPASALLAANLVSSVSSSLSLSFLQPHPVFTFDSPDVQSIMKCISPRSFSRSAVNKGLLHSNFSVKHGTLRLLLEALKLLDYFLNAISFASRSTYKNRDTLTSLKKDILNEVRLFLPDPQVILNLLSTVSQLRDRNSCSKRAADVEILEKQNRRTAKKPKGHILKEEEADIIVAGIVVDDNDDIIMEEKIDEGTRCADESHRKIYSELSEENWWLERCSTVVTASQDEDIYFQSKLLEAVKFYFHILPDALESSFDFFVNFLSNASSLPNYFLQSLMSLLVQYTAESTGTKAESKTLPLMYKHLQTFTNLMIFSPVDDIRKQAYVMAQSALLSTGAFDNNLSEIQAWFLFMPGFCRGESLSDYKEMEVLHNFSSVVSSFLCDAISTVGNNLFKHWDLLRHQIDRVVDVKDMSPAFSPLAPCIFQKCLRLLNSESGTFTYPGKMMVALYVCNTLKYILQTQVDAKLFAAWIDLALSEGLENASHSKNEFFNKWRPVWDLWNFSKSVSNFEAHKLLDPDVNDMHSDPSFVSTLDEVKTAVGTGVTRELDSLTESVCTSTIGTSSEDILSNFPTTIEVLGALLGKPLSFLSSVFFSHSSVLVKALKSQPDRFALALESVTSLLHEKEIKNVNFEVSNQPLHADIKLYNLLTESGNSTVAMFDLFLDLVPFHIVFPLFMSIDSLQLMDKIRLIDWLLFKVSKSSFNLLIPNLRMALFWFDKVQHYLRKNPLAELVRLSEICFSVIEILLDQIWVARKDYEHSTWLEALLSEKMIAEAAASVFCHPSVKNSLEVVFKSGVILTNQVHGAAWRDFLFSGCKLNDGDGSDFGLATVDNVSLRILKKTSDKLLFLHDGDLCLNENHAGMKNIFNFFVAVTERLIMGLKNKINACTKSNDLAQVMSTIHVFCSVKQLIPPYELLGLAHWALNRVSKKDLSNLKSHRSDAHVVCFHITHGIFETLAWYWGAKSEHQQVQGVDHGFSVLILDMYFKIADMASHVELEIVDLCLLEAIKFISMLQCKPQQKIRPPSLDLSMAVASTPNELVSHCIQGITITKARLLFLLTELSPLHLSVFGDTFLGISNPCDMSEDQLLMLLPTALSYINWSLLKFGKEHLMHLTSTLTLYSRTILKGFSNWNSCVSNCLFQEDYNELALSSLELRHLCSESLLVKAITLLKFSCAISNCSIIMKTRVKLFGSIFSHSTGQDELLGCDITELQSYSSSQLINFLSKVMAKTLFCEFMLFPDSFQEQSSQPEDSENGNYSTKLKSSRLRFINILMNSWCSIVSASGSRLAKSGDSMTELLKQFEVFLLEKIVEAVEKTRDCLIQLHSIPFLEQFYRTSLLYRFEDTKTLKMLRSTLALLLEGQYASDLFLQLLLSHSHFVSAMHIDLASTERRQAGLVAGQVSSILKAVAFGTDTDGKTDTVISDYILRKLEVIKLLRLLFYLSCRKWGNGSEKHLDINLRELFLLLLSSYSATLSEVDLEIYSLINDIESTDGLDCWSLSDMDYMWGSAALIVKQNQEFGVSASHAQDVEEVKVWRRTQLRENLLFDPKLLLITVLNFPHNRKTSNAEFDACGVNVDKVHSLDMDNIKGYDPVFILRLSTHILSMRYFEPWEFAGLGLLPLAFVSISSPDAGIRNLGYEVLGIFLSALEKSQSRKDVMHLRLLLTCVQNGIEQTLQQIPSIIGIFAAEASTILLDAANDHYDDIVKLLKSSSVLKFKKIFDTFFWSSSLSFKNDRMWILRLCYKGLLQKEDAHIYIRCSVLENILSYYSSPFADDESKMLILLILTKAATLPKTAEHLVQKCSLIPWLSHRVTYFSNEMVGERKRTLVAQLNLVCKVVMEIGSSRKFAEWLQDHFLEQLSEFSSHVYKLLLVNGEMLVREYIDLVDSILQILTLTAKLSQKRNIFQPHFTLSFDGLFQIYTLVSNKDLGCRSTAELGLKAILMSTPPVAISRMKPDKLLEFFIWGISTAASIDFVQSPTCSTCDPHLIFTSEGLHEDSLTSKLVRWLSASVILENTSCLANKSNLVTTDYENLQSLLEHIKQGQDSMADKSESNKILANSIFYLYHYLLRHNCKTAPSAIAALCMLLFPRPVSAAGSMSFNPVDFEIHVAPLASKIRPPPEANPKWRWTFYQPWEDRTSILSDSEKLEELIACERLLGTILNVLQKNPSDSQLGEIPKVDD